MFSNLNKHHWLTDELKYPPAERASSEVVTYRLSDEELEKYRKMKPDRDTKGNLVGVRK